jgi:hypothetical protein
MEGRLPGFWQRDVTFFANLLSLFFGNEGGTASLRKEVGEIDSYGGRLVPLINLLFKKPSNLLILQHTPDEALCGYFRDDLGLTLPEMHILPHAEFLELGDESGEVCADSASVLAKHTSQWIDGFVTDATLEQIAKRLGKKTITTESGSRRGNNKLLLFQFLKRNGLPVVDTYIAESPAEVPRCVRELAKRGFRKAVIKAQVGASGIGMVKLDDINRGIAIDASPEYLFHEGPCLVQGWLEPGYDRIREVRSPSVQLFIEDSAVYLYDVTEQILSESSVHEGNESPPAYLDEFPGLRKELLQQAGAAAQWLHGTGYRGTASADLIVVDYEDRRAPGVYVCELNARVTGATYPSVLARHFLPRGAWLHRNLRLREPLTGEKLLRMLGEGGHLYDPGETRGVLPVNFNFGKDRLIHKGQFLCIAESSEGCHDYLDRMQAETDIEWAFDRD